MPAPGIPLLQTVFGFVLLVVLVRLLLALFRADYYNPISQIVVKATNPFLRPLQRIIPTLWGVDLAAVALLVGAQVLALVTTLLVLGDPLPGIGALLLWSIIGLGGLLVNFYFFAILIVIILSWIMPGSRHPALYLLLALTEPVLAPFRRLLPSLGGLDLSPLLVFFTINLALYSLRLTALGVGLEDPSLVIGL